MHGAHRGMPYPEITKEQVDRNISTDSLCDLSRFDFAL